MIGGDESGQEFGHDAGAGPLVVGHQFDGKLLLVDHFVGDGDSQFEMGVDAFGQFDQLVDFGRYLQVADLDVLAWGNQVQDAFRVFDQFSVYGYSDVGPIHFVIV